MLIDFVVSITKIELYIFILFQNFRPKQLPTKRKVYSSTVYFIMFTLLFATILLTLQQPTFAADNDMQCTEGFVMDLFCINRGTLLDAPGVVTLQNPEKHSVHCLVDVGVCVNSGYNILLPNPKFGQGSEPKFVHALTLDEAGNDLVLKFARENGRDCSTCTGSGKIKAGLRLTYIGKVIPQGDNVAMFQVKNISLSPRIADPNSNDDGCPNAMKRVDISRPLNISESGERQNPNIKHEDDMQHTEGFVDFSCISRTRLFDNPNVKTLDILEKHTVRCLVDVRLCVNSSYNISPNPNFEQGNETKFAHALTLDKTWNDLVVKFAQENDVCSTCTKSDKIRARLRFTFIRKVIPQGNDVAMFQFQNISLSPRIADPNSNDDGCLNAMKRVDISRPLNISESGDRQDLSISHGSLTIISWGFLLSTVVASVLLIS